MSALLAAIAALKRGEIVAFPTETVFALGVDADNEQALAQLFELKQRPRSKPITVHLGTAADPSLWGHWSQEAEKLAAAFWPGPLTLIVGRTARACDLLTAGGKGIGLRMPDHPTAARLLNGFGSGVAATSANSSGERSLTTEEQVRAKFGPHVAVVLSGSCRLQRDSTVCSLLEECPTILRQGAVVASEIVEVLGFEVKSLSEE